MFYYVYILISLKDGSFYIGYTADLVKRVKQHNNGESLATKPHRPYKLIFYETFLDRIDAKRREKYLKGGYGRKSIKTILGKYLKNINTADADYRAMAGLATIQADIYWLKLLDPNVKELLQRELEKLKQK